MRWTTLTLPLPCLILCGCDYGIFESADRYKSDFHYSYPMHAGGRLEVETFNGEIEVTGWDQPACDISGSKFAYTENLRDRIKIDISHTGDIIYVRSVRPVTDQGPLGGQGKSGVRYTIRVPRKVELSRIISSNAAIQVEDIEGPADLKTSNGPVRANSVRRGLTVHSSNGPITAGSILGMASLHTSNGPIHAEQVEGGIEAGTSNGPITVDFAGGAPSAPVKLETKNGSIEITMDAPPRSEIHAATSNSAITVGLPANASARLRAVTTNGKVDSEFSANGAPAEPNGRQRSIEEDIGGGGPLIDLHTTNGNIRVSRRGN